jgi:hypothetical protein
MSLNSGIGSHIIRAISQAAYPRSGSLLRLRQDQSNCMQLQVPEQHPPAGSGHHPETGIPRKAAVICNIVPWYLGADDKIHPAQAADLTAGLWHDDAASAPGSVEDGHHHGAEELSGADSLLLRWPESTPTQRFRGARCLRHQLTGSPDRCSDTTVWCDRCP